MSKNRYKWIRRFSEVSIRDIPDVGGKNASLGEMYSQLTDKGIRVPDGFSIGSNDLTQLTLGVDRDSSLPGNFDERDPAVLEMISIAIAACRRTGKHSGICGQAPSDFPELATWLVEQGIDSISVNRDALITVTGNVIAAEDKTTPPRRDTGELIHINASDLNKRQITAYIFKITP